MDIVVFGNTRENAIPDISTIEAVRVTDYGPYMNCEKEESRYDLLPRGIKLLNLEKTKRYGKTTYNFTIVLEDVSTEGSLYGNIPKESHIDSGRYRRRYEGRDIDMLLISRSFDAKAFCIDHKVVSGRDKTIVYNNAGKGWEYIKY